MKINTGPDVRNATYEYIMSQPLSESSNIKTCALLLESMVHKISQADTDRFGSKMKNIKRGIKISDP